MSNLLAISDDQIKKYHDDREIVRKTALQLIKDFDRFGIRIQFPVDLSLAYDELYIQLLRVIQNLMNTNLSTLYSLLYTIDLSENTIKKGAAKMEDFELHEVISHLLLERELRKVLTREYFSRNK